MTIDELKERKAELGYTNERISELSGVPLSTVQKIFAGITMQPRYDTLLSLERVLMQGRDRVSEPGFEYWAGRNTAAERTTDYTLEEFFAITGDRRAELIDGEIFYFSSPAIVHQIIMGEIWKTLDDYISSRGGDCLPLMASCDVQLRKHVDEIFVPDVFVVCDRKKVGRKYIEGSPDLIVEILSPSTKRRDMSLKLNKYLDAGVREYWIVDPDQKKILVYLPEVEFDFRIYGFEDQVPVNIFKGGCKVDFTRIQERIAFLDELE